MLASSMYAAMAVGAVLGAGVGSQLVVNNLKSFVGSVSGGCIEGAVIQTAIATMQSGEPQLLNFSVTNELAWEVGLACGGTIEVYVERIG